MKQTNKDLYAFVVFAMILCFGVSKSISQVTDLDGNTYKTVKVREQEWMAENLNVSHYRNGNIIPQVKDDLEWAKL